MSPEPTAEASPDDGPNAAEEAPPLPIDVRIAQVTSNAGHVANLPTIGITCLVGGNNVGKSQLLRDAIAIMDGQGQPLVVLSALQLSRPATASDADILAFLEETTQKQVQMNQQPIYHPMSGGAALTASDFGQWFRSGDVESNLRQIRPYFCLYADAQSRASLGSGSVAPQQIGANPHPLVTLYRDSTKEKRLSGLANQVFGFPLTLDRVNGAVLLRVGKPALPAPTVDAITIEYCNEVAELPPVDAQGDGVKSFIGLALYVMAGRQPMVLIDEPEAFLHQSQSKALGRWLARESMRSNRQVILATHDRDFLVGLLSAQDADVSVIRITRNENSTHLNQLNPTELKSVWDDPILRYSNVLDGLFYSGVVICEADADCRFYAAVLDNVYESSGFSHSPDDLLFVPSGGKDRIPKIASALSALSVQVRAIADFDVLNDRAKVKLIVESVGGVWSADADTWYVAMADPLNRGGLWDQAKKQGVDAVPPGPPTVAANALLEYLRTQNVHIVPVGEMEDFDRTVSDKGTSWVNAMLDKRAHETNTAARNFVKNVAESF